MKRLLCILFLSAVLVCGMVSCTREPSKLDRNDTGASDVTSSVPESDSDGEETSGKFIIGGVDTSGNFGEFIPIH